MLDAVVTRRERGFRLAQLGDRLLAASQQGTGPQGDADRARGSEGASVLELLPTSRSASPIRRGAGAQPTGCERHGMAAGYGSPNRVRPAPQRSRSATAAVNSPVAIGSGSEREQRDVHAAWKLEVVAVEPVLDDGGVSRLRRGDQTRRLDEHGQRSGHRPELVIERHLQGVAGIGLGVNRTAGVQLALRRNAIA